MELSFFDIGLRIILFFDNLADFGIVFLWRRIRTVLMMELPQVNLEGDCLYTDSVISFFTECPDLGNWRLQYYFGGPERTTILVVRLYRICRDTGEVPPSLVHYINLKRRYHV